jgi:site-specific DNA recombinase
VLGNGSGDYPRRSASTGSSRPAGGLPSLQSLVQKVKRGMSRLSDGHQDGLLDRGAFEPRLRHCQERLQTLTDQIATVAAEQSRRHDLQLVVGQVETFAKSSEGCLEQADWATKRQVITTLVKEIEIGAQAVKVVYRIDSPPFA